MSFWGSSSLGLSFPGSLVVPLTAVAGGAAVWALAQPYDREGEDAVDAAGDGAAAGATTAGSKRVINVAAQVGPRLHTAQVVAAKAGVFPAGVISPVVALTARLVGSAIFTIVIGLGRAYSTCLLVDVTTTAFHLVAKTNAYGVMPVTGCTAGQIETTAGAIQ